MKNFKLLSLLFSILLLTNTQLNYAQDKSSDIMTLKSMVINKLNKIKETNASGFADREIKKIEKFISLTDKFLKDGDDEKAYYAISIGLAYFNLIDDKRQYLEEKKEIAEKKLN